MSVHADPPPSVVSEPFEFQYATGPQLGKGGFAICHRAELLENNRPTGQIVALKIVRSKMEPAKLAQKFVTELQLHSKLHHPNIVEFYRAFSYQINTYVVLEICENGSLADALKRRKYFTMPEIRRFIIQTCGAVKYLHERNVVHRDLKTGNLFLDKNMNVKVGDMGLAAVLMSKDDLGIRRTTMCGTPNYLAPEILEKGGRGHNEKVDLWAIGIIAYTLAVGRAPFHAPKREDIYKKLQARDYKWPEISKIQNEISNDLRDLVGSLLVHEDDRPNPDQIVSHPFFKMQFIPLQLSAECTQRAPRWSNIAPPSAKVIRQGFSDYWFRICSESGVGEYAPGKVFPVCGGKRVRSVVKDCERELRAGKNPIVPIPAGTVYLPYPQRHHWPFSRGHSPSEVTEDKSSEEEHLLEITGNDRMRSSRPATANFRAGRSPPLKENVEPVSTEEEEEVAQPVRPKRSRPVRTASDEPPQPTLSAPPTRPMRPLRGTQSVRSTTETVTMERAARITDRTVEPHRMQGLRKEKKPVEIPQIESSPEPVPESRPRDSRIVPFSDPISVLDRVSKLRDNLARAISNRPITSRHPPSKKLPFVSKWVDYSRKHGVGYVLEDGSIGCIANATEKYPVTHFVVRDGYEHLKEMVKDSRYAEKLPIEYYIDTESRGLRRTTVDSARRRTTGILWVKFSKYMCQQLGQAEIRDPSEKSATSTTFVRFYQRLGSVGIWGFEDGSFQFNFPDHTKLVLSSDGSYCHFTCLSVDAANYLAEYSDLPFKYIRQRDVLASTVRNLLHGSSQETAAFRPVTKANRLSEKLEFIIAVMDEWVESGGLGCLSKAAENMKWEGPQVSESKKHDWVTVGRYGGDGPRA